MGDNPVKLADDINEITLEKSSSDTNPVIDDDLTTPISPTRSRRPTFVLEETTTRMSTNTSAQQSEKWTAKRVLKVTWAYVTTVKVLVRGCLG
jgi:hypothetical protein